MAIIYLEAVEFFAHKKKKATATLTATVTTGSCKALCFLFFLGVVTHLLFRTSSYKVTKLQRSPHPLPSSRYWFSLYMMEQQAQQVSFLPTASRAVLLERTLCGTLFCSLIADYCGGNLPCTDAWVFFCLASLYLGNSSLPRPLVVGFFFGVFTLVSDIFFLAMVSVFDNPRAREQSGAYIAVLLYFFCCV